MVTRIAATLRTAALALALGVTACALPSLPESPRLYTLTPAEGFEADLPRADWQLLVEVPTAAAGLDSTRIALRESPTTLDYFANVAWTDRATRMIQTLLVESFENSERIVSIGRNTVGLRSDYLLLSELRDFQAEYAADAPPRVRVRLNAKIVAMPRRDVVANETFEAMVEAESLGFADIVEAWNRATHDVLRRVVAWALRRGGSAQG